MESHAQGLGRRSPQSANGYRDRYRMAAKAISHRTGWAEARGAEEVLESMVGVITWMLRCDGVCACLRGYPFGPPQHRFPTLHHEPRPASRAFPAS